MTPLMSSVNLGTTLVPTGRHLYWIAVGAGVPKERCECGQEIPDEPKHPKPTLPMTMIQGRDGRLVASFHGKLAREKAKAWMQTHASEMPEDGWVYDVHDDWCPDCGATFWHEAREEDPEPASDAWLCPNCGSATKGE